MRSQYGKCTSSRTFGGANSWRGGFMLGATLYLRDVQPQGGGLFVWPRSHAAVHRYFQRHEGSIDGRYCTDPDYLEKGWTALYQGDEGVLPPQEFVAKADTLLLWRAWTVHSASLNCRPDPRIAVHLRYYDDRQQSGSLVRRHGMSRLPGDPGPGALDPNAPSLEEQRQQLWYQIGAAENHWEFWGAALAAAPPLPLEPSARSCSSRAPLVSTSYK